MDVRHQLRTTIVQELYSRMFVTTNEQTDIPHKTSEIIRNKEIIHGYITRFASKFPINKIARVDLAILELSIYELAIEKKEPPKVVINEAVELAKELGSDRSYAFINAILGKIYTVINKD